jgi:hypothetical protein
MRKVTYPEMLIEAHKLADDELLLCRYEITKYVEAEIDVNNEGLITGVRLKSPDEPGFTVNHFFLALGRSLTHVEEYKEWEVIKIVRVGIDPNYP